MSWSSDHLILSAFVCYGNLMSPITLRSCYEFTDAVTNKDGVYSSGFATCKNGRTSFSSNPNNCGSCGAKCPGGPHSQRICNTRESRDCDGNSSNDCEINVEKDPKNCGTCGVACNVPQNSNSTCSRGSICKMHCAQGLKYCHIHNNNVSSCLPIQNVVSNCGGCGKTCANALNSDATCLAGACGLSCHLGFPKWRPQCQHRMRGRHQQRPR